MSNRYYSPWGDDSEGGFWYPEDVAKIVEVLADAGVELSPERAHDAWVHFSYSLRVGWMLLPRTDDSLVRIVLHSLEKLKEGIGYDDGLAEVFPEDVMAQRWLSQGGAK